MKESTVEECANRITNKVIEIIKKERERAAEYIDEAEYALIGGNLKKEDIPYDTAAKWFRYLSQKIRGRE